MKGLALPAIETIDGRINTLYKMLRLFNYTLRAVKHVLVATILCRHVWIHTR